ncbi:MAG: hypothetical protein GXP54_12830 [Deltaproteobacteria bacterium]|nr:hypothetical protein [Deltaproteobacteria bacterium]
MGRKFDGWFDRGTPIVHRRWIAACVVACVLISCGPEQDGVGAYALDDVSVVSITPSVWLDGTKVTVSGTGFVPPEVGEMSMTITGADGAQQVAVAVYLDYVGPDQATFSVGQGLIALLPLDAGSFQANVTVRRAVGGDLTDSAVLDLEIEVVSSLTPNMSAVTPLNAFIGQEMEVHGSGFIFAGESAAGEGDGAAMPGSTILELDGTFHAKGGDGAIEKKVIAIPLKVIDRTLATFILTPDLLGLGPGAFEGSARIENLFQGDAGRSLDVAGNDLSGLRIEIARTRLNSIRPTTIHRGQQLVFDGNGFLALDGDLGTVTFLTFIGTQTGPDASIVHSGANPLVLVPDRVEGNYLASLVVRTLVGPDGMPAGFGSGPAVLEGTFTPHVVFKDEILKGQGLDAVLEVGRQIQVVYLRFMPTFEDGIRSFGLQAVSQLVKERALEVCIGDYQGISVDFRLDPPPADWVEYTTAEVMNRDPNDAGLLGLDNTFGKDVGNLRLNELLGGYNAVSAEAGYFPYGGVFLESFLNFSPTLSSLDESMTAPAFDSVFASVIPELGGTPVGEGEYPGGGRDPAISEAVRVLGNLIGDTVSHEVGHSLGLAALEGHFHNVGDNPGYIMDAGAFRPFEERAQLPGGKARVFAPWNRAYLEEILPVD